MGRRLALAAALAAPFAVPAAHAGAASKPPLTRSPLLWATVNVCDTKAHPNTIGVRGSMPGSGSKTERMFMRFVIQYRSTSDHRWRAIGKGGDSSWVSVGSARFKSRQAGESFQFAAPGQGQTQTLRGQIRFQWRRGTTVVRSATRLTAAGHRSAAGADPAGYSAANCVLR